MLSDIVRNLKGAGPVAEKIKQLFDFQQRRDKQLRISSKCGWLSALEVLVLVLVLSDWNFWTLVGELSRSLQAILIEAFFHGCM
ncbi:unnamed protein product [Coffea canephora]|uniref:Uncharacterized protein n=1 Tax=Coffea canephora TaxID=49390 RepID=A0A068VDA3_COFCA|nr:unnamed protein product [Coffea canephora]